ncbi:MAG: transcriptional regulator BetI [Pseudomonadota bacterium]
MTDKPIQMRPRTESREVRRKQLIEATIEVIADNGLSGTTMALVTQRAKVSMGLVSFHFKSKENLLHETLIYLAEEHRACWKEKLAGSALSPKAKLAAVIDAHFHESTCSDQRIRVWFAFFSEPKYRECYRTHISDFDEERSQVVAEQCAALMAGKDHHFKDANEIATNIESLADGLWLSIMLYPDELTRADAKRQMQAYLTSVLPVQFTSWPVDEGIEMPRLETGT